MEFFDSDMVYNVLWLVSLVQGSFQLRARLVIECRVEFRPIETECHWVDRVLMEGEMVSNADARVIKSGAHASWCMCVCVYSGCLGEKEKKRVEKIRSRFFKGTRDKSRSGPSDIPLAAALIRSTIFFSILR